jgi:hypothetical protein
MVTSRQREAEAFFDDFQRPDSSGRKLLCESVSDCTLSEVLVNVLGTDTSIQ